MSWAEIFISGAVISGGTLLACIIATRFVISIVWSPSKCKKAYTEYVTNVANGMKSFY